MNTVLGTKRNDYVVAIDTDSVYLTLEKMVGKIFPDGVKSTEDTVMFMDKVCEKKIQPFIDKGYQELADKMNAFTQKMIMKREVLADKAIWVAKKRYIMNVHNSEGVQYAKPKVKVMGLEMVKSSTPMVVRNKFEHFIQLILNGDESILQKAVKEYREEFYAQSPEQVAAPRGINGLREYSDSTLIYKKATPIHVRGALLFNHYVKKAKLDDKYELIKEGDKIKYIYLKKPNRFNENVISFGNILPEELNIHDDIDYEMQFMKAFLDPLQIILDSINWKSEKTATLSDFFS